MQDALDEIARQKQRDLFKPLRVHFIGEDGIDAGARRAVEGCHDLLSRECHCNAHTCTRHAPCSALLQPLAQRPAAHQAHVRPALLLHRRRRREEGVLPAAGHRAALPRLRHAHLPAGGLGLGVCPPAAPALSLAAW